jgi:hypothetical protein
MSGPKVVRIVTREEIEAICRRHISAVEAAAFEFRRRARRCGMLDNAFEQALADRLSAFDALFAGKAWMGIQKGGPQAIAFMRSEGDRLEATAAATAAAARTRGRRAVDAARSLVAAIEAAGSTVPQGLRAAAEARASSLDEAERQVAAALALIPTARASPTATAARTELAHRLGANEGSRTIAEWVAARVPEPTSTERRLDALLAELGLLAEGVDDFVRRANAIAREPDASHRALLTDSLVMDAAAHVRVIRAREVMAARLREAAASLALLSSQEAVALHARLLSAANGVSPELHESLVVEAAELMDADVRVAASQARRHAVLSGLASLGYEVRETMAADWARDGRIVVRKPGATDYGVELGAPADAARLQVRLVGSYQPALPRDARRDADQETIWCSEFERLKSEMAASGGELIVERALAPGEQALRSVTLPGFTQGSDAAAIESTKMNDMTFR